MLEILQWAEVLHSPECIQGILLYTEEVYLKSRHRLRRKEARVSQDVEITNAVRRVVLSIASDG